MNMINLVKILLGLILVFLIGIISYAYIQNQESTIETASASTDTSLEAEPKKEEKPELSEKNREAAKKALNAVGEIESTASVGANYQQFTDSVQSAKIKFDAALREFEGNESAENEIRRDLAEVFVCYVDAKDAWSEFIEDGDKYGFLKPGSYSKVERLASEYNFSRSDGEYYRDTVLRSILLVASKKFNAVSGKLK